MLRVLLQVGNTSLLPVVQARFVGEQLFANTNQVESAMDVYLVYLQWIPSLLNIGCCSLGCILIQKYLQTRHLKPKMNQNKPACCYDRASSQSPYENLLASSYTSLIISEYEVNPKG